MNEHLFLLKSDSCFVEIDRDIYHDRNCHAQRDALPIFNQCNASVCSFKRLFFVLILIINCVWSVLIIIRQYLYSWTYLKTYFHRRESSLVHSLLERSISSFKTFFLADIIENTYIICLSVTFIVVQRAFEME